ncbi:hypothetical protein JOE68_001256 [Saccharothrix algeriensis]|uniref:Uncharacterized protein n=1 Tax=Saccharothrix algeriensis TaxID=173560 RepID=A0ABS2S2B6_9PSEU|nr:hypothetical protein [Saccharothrix algeriensis]
MPKSCAESSSTRNAPCRRTTSRTRSARSGSHSAPVGPAKLGWAWKARAPVCSNASASGSGPSGPLGTGTSATPTWAAARIAPQ